jgi:hypothetical protein
MPPGIGYDSNSAQELIQAARGGDDPTDFRAEAPEMESSAPAPAPAAEVPNRSPEQVLEQKGWFQPEGDPYMYKVEGDTVRFATPDMETTGEVSKSQIINENPEWAERNLNVDLSKKTADNTDGPTVPRDDSPVNTVERARRRQANEGPTMPVNTVEGAIQRQQSTAPQSPLLQSDEGGDKAVDNVMQRLRTAQPERPSEGNSTAAQARPGSGLPTPDARNRTGTGGSMPSMQGVFDMIQTLAASAPPDSVQQAARAQDTSMADTSSASVSVGAPLPRGSMQSMQRRAQPSFTGMDSTGRGDGTMRPARLDVPQMRPDRPQMVQGQPETLDLLRLSGAL